MKPWYYIELRSNVVDQEPQEARRVVREFIKTHGICETADFGRIMNSCVIRDDWTEFKDRIVNLCMDKLGKPAADKEINPLRAAMISRKLMADSCMKS